MKKLPNLVKNILKSLCSKHFKGLQKLTLT